jgi:hypothetical protein
MIRAETAGECQPSELPQDSRRCSAIIRETAVEARRWGVSTRAPAARAARASAGSGGSMQTMARVGVPARAMR